MAWDWIKMTTNLPRNPKVVRVSVALGAHASAVCGGLFFLWSLFDEQSKNGELGGYTYDVLDKYVGVDGFCAALETVGWIEKTSVGVRLPRFETHNGKTAKKRAQTALRSSRFRNADSVTKSAPRARARARAEQEAEQRAEQDQEKKKRACMPLPISLSSKNACSLLLAAGLDPAAAASVAATPGVDECRVAWAASRLRDELANARMGKRGPIDNPAGYIRELVLKKHPPPAWRRQWLERQAAGMAAKDGERKSAG